MPDNDPSIDWVRKAGRERLARMAKAIYDAHDEATDRLDIRDGEVIRLTLMEAINQLQNGQGMIPAPLLERVATEIAAIEESEIESKVRRAAERVLDRQPRPFS